MSNEDTLPWRELHLSGSLSMTAKLICLLLWPPVPERGCIVSVESHFHKFLFLAYLKQFIGSMMKPYTWSLTALVGDPRGSITIFTANVREFKIYRIVLILNLRLRKHGHEDAETTSGGL